MEVIQKVIEGNKEIAVYRKSEVSDILKQGNEVNNRREQKCRNLGLTAQLTIMGLGGENEKLTSELYPEITGYELKIWRTFLPMTYHKSRGEWSNYKYDAIPLKALEEIEIALSLRVFSDLQIWTPERASDPAVVGVQTRNKYFMVSRWAESLRPFHEIEKIALLKEVYRVDLNSLPQITIDCLCKLQKELLNSDNSERSFIYNGQSILYHCCKQRMHKFTFKRFADLLGLNYFICSLCGKIMKRKFLSIAP